MIETGYTSDQMIKIIRNQQQAIDVSMNALTRIAELLSAWHVRPTDVEVCLVTAQNAVENMQAHLSKNPLTRCDQNEYDRSKKHYRR